MEESQFRAVFGGQPVPSSLLQLLTFQNRYPQYSEALSLSDDEQSGLVHGWSSNPDFLGHLVAFARANASGSFYALWNDGANSWPEQWPVVIFGDEGGEWVVAADITGLLRISSYDTEPSVGSDGVSFYRDPKWWEPSQFAEEFRSWLKAEMQIEATDDPDEIVQDAQAKFQAAFDKWKCAYF